MKTYRPKSWSQQAREMCQKQINQVNSGWSTIDHAVYFFHWSHRNKLITQRAAKMFGRAVKKGLVHENLDLFREHWTDKELLQNHALNGTPLPKWLQ